MIIFFSSKYGYKEILGKTWEYKNRNAACELHDILLCPHTTSVSWLGPNRLTVFAFSHSGRHKDRICLWLKSTPTFLSYMLTSVLRAPLSCSLLLCADTKTLAHIAVLRNANTSTNGFFLETGGGKVHRVSLLELSSKLSSTCYWLNVLLCMWII